MTTKRMKSSEVRADWKKALQFVGDGGTIVVEHYDEPVAFITPYQEARMPTSVIWSVVRGESPDADAVEPAPIGVDLPGDVLAWAEGHGVSMDDSDVYVLVTLKDKAGEVMGEIASMEGTVPAEDGDRIREALEQEDD